MGEKLYLKRLLAYLHGTNSDLHMTGFIKACWGWFLVYYVNDVFQVKT